MHMHAHMRNLGTARLPRCLSSLLMHVLRTPQSMHTIIPAGRPPDCLPALTHARAGEKVVVKQSDGDSQVRKTKEKKFRQHSLPIGARTGQHYTDQDEPTVEKPTHILYDPTVSICMA